MMAECSLIADEKTNMGLGSWRRKRVDRMEWRVGAVSGSSSRAPWPGERGTVTGSDATCWGGVSAAERPHVAPCSAVQGKRKQRGPARQLLLSTAHWVFRYARKRLVL
jgi:hypothetical protein